MERRRQNNVDCRAILSKENNSLDEIKCSNEQITEMKEDLKTPVNVYTLHVFNIRCHHILVSTKNISAFQLELHYKS